MGYMKAQAKADRGCIEQPSLQYGQEIIGAIRKPKRQVGIVYGIGEEVKRHVKSGSKQADTIGNGRNGALLSHIDLAGRKCGPCARFQELAAALFDHFRFFADRRV